MTSILNVCACISNPSSKILADLLALNTGPGDAIGVVSDDGATLACNNSENSINLQYRKPHDWP